MCCEDWLFLFEGSGETEGGGGGEVKWRKRGGGGKEGGR